MTSPTAVTASTSESSRVADFIEPFRVARLLYYAALVPLSATAFRPLLGLTLSDWLFFASLGALVIELVTTRGKPLSGHPAMLVYGVGVFAIGGTVSSVSATYPSASFAVLARFIYLTLIWFWLGIMVLRTHKQIVCALALWILSAAIAGSAAIAQVLWGFKAIPSGLAGPDFSVVGRMAGVTLHPNDLGAITSLAVVPCLVLLTRKRQPFRVVIACSGALLLIVGGLIVSGSVGGFVTTLLGVIVWMLVFGGVRHGLLLLCVVGVAAAGLTLESHKSLPFLSPLQRISQVTTGATTGSFYTRLRLDGATIDVIVRRPIVGVGLDPASQRQFVTSPPENMYLLAWLGGGLFGFVGLLLIILSCLREGLRKLRLAHRPTPWEICAGLFISFLTTLVFALASPILQQRYAWIALALLLAVRPEPERTRKVELTPNADSDRGADVNRSWSKLL